MQMSNMPLVSRHLTRLELTGIWFCRCINLDVCPALKDLEIEGCDMLDAEPLSPAARSSTIRAFMVAIF
jgi:hypothetical protein